jgi:HAD superfamily hydrolase (TIGR01509 family)
MSTQPLRAVLFDMDGVLVDSEPHWFAAETATADWLGCPWTKADQHALLGTNLPFAADYLLRLSGATRSRQEVMDHLRDAMTAQLLSGGVQLLPGAGALLAELRGAGIPVGLVTSSVRVHVVPVLAQLPDVSFDTVVTADDVERRKPDPQPYLLALDRLQVPATGTVVLEDSPPGVAAAQAAGCLVVAVPNLVDIPAAPGRVVVSSLSDLDLRKLRRLVADLATC